MKIWVYIWYWSKDIDGKMFYYEKKYLYENRTAMLIMVNV